MKKALGCLVLTAAVVIPITVLATDDDDQSSQRSIFQDKEKEAVIQADQQQCSVIEPDIADTVTLDVLKRWKYQTKNYGYPKALTSVCFLNYDNEAEYPLSILLEEQEVYGQTQLVPPKGFVGNKDYSLWNSAEYYAKRVMHSVNENDLQLLNAIHTTDPNDYFSKDRIMHTGFVVFGPYESSDLYNRKCQLNWYTIKDEHTLISQHDGSVIKQSSLWYYTKELLISIYNFVNCPKHPVTKPVNPPLQWPVPTDEDKQKQEQLFNDRGCAVFGNEIVYKGKKGSEWEQDCRPALLQEMKRVCGKQYKAEEATRASCIIHGASSDYNWKMPRRSSLPIEPELWTVAVLRSYIYDFGFGWLFGYAFSGASNPQFGGMVAILAVDNLDDCEYQTQDGESRLKADTDRSKGVIRYNYAQTFTGVDTSKVPDAWIYPSSAANNCGLRLLGQYYFRPDSVAKPDLSIPDACSVSPVFDGDASLERVEKYKHEIAQQGYNEIYPKIFVFHWNEAEESLRWAEVDFEVKHSGHSIRYAAALHLQNQGLGAIRASDLFWMHTSEGKFSGASDNPFKPWFSEEIEYSLSPRLGIFLPIIQWNFNLELDHYGWPQNQEQTVKCKEASNIPAPYNLIPNGCMLNRHFKSPVSEKKLEDWKYMTDDQGLGNDLELHLFLMFWDDSDRILYQVKPEKDYQIHFNLLYSSHFGQSIRDRAASELKNRGFGDIEPANFILLSGQSFINKISINMVLFLPNKVEITGYLWERKDGFSSLWCK